MIVGNCVCFFMSILYVYFAVTIFGGGWSLAGRGVGQMKVEEGVVDRGVGWDGEDTSKEGEGTLL